MSKDYYKILGVEKNASEEDIKKAFRKKAHQFHPDKDGGDERKFKEINEAYQVLGNKQKRTQYDQFGSAFDQTGGAGAYNWQDFAQGYGGGRGGFYSNVDFGDLGDLGDIFSGIFGGGQSSSARRRENLDVETQIGLSFMESVFGAQKEIKIKKILTCETCHGNKAKPGTKIKTCSHCGGSGKVTHMQNVLFGHIQTSKPCPQCNGEGKIPEVKCTACHGNGVVTGTETVSFKIPAGIRQNEIIRISGKGNASQYSSAKGDLYIKINVQESHEFKRDEDDIHTKQEISFSESVLGGKINVKTVHGDISLKVPAATASETVFRLRGQGVPHLKQGGKGDHYVTISVHVPKALTKEQKEAVKKLRDAGL